MTPSDTRTLIGMANTCFPGLSPRLFRLKARMLWKGYALPRAVAPFLHPEPGTALARAMAQRPQILGALIWPYQCAAWDAHTRLSRIRAHYAEIDRLGAPFQFDLDEKLVIADLGESHEGLRLVVDQPQWFMREGGLVVNLFVGDFRAFSLAFSLWRAPDRRLVAVLGGLQGRNRDDALALYRQLTKDLHGLRPRDFMLEVFRVICRFCRVEEIHAVTQGQRHHVHPFFGEKDLTPDYDAIWEDRQGVRMNDHFYSLPVAPETRDLATVKPKKRSLYRKRFAFLDALEGRVLDGLGAARPVRFTDT